MQPLLLMTSIFRRFLLAGPLFLLPTVSQTQTNGTCRGQSKNPRLKAELPEKWKFMADWDIDSDVVSYDKASRAHLAACGVHSFSWDRITGPLTGVDADEVYGRVAPDVLHYGAAVNLVKAEELLRVVENMRDTLPLSYLRQVISGSPR